MADETTEGAVKTPWQLAGLWLLVLLMAGALLPGVTAAQDDPASQCARGVRLFQAWRLAEARQPLEAGYAGRDRGNFKTIDELGYCALALGLIRSSGGDYAGALEAYDVALSSFRTAGNQSYEGTILYRIGQVYENLGEYRQALDTYHQSLVIAQGLADQPAEASILEEIGSIYESQGPYSEALTTYLRALEIRVKIDDEIGAATALDRIGGILSHQGRYDEAMTAYEQELAIQQELGERGGSGVTLNNMGIVYQDQALYAKALECFELALTIARSLGNRNNEAVTLSNIGTLYHDQGRYEEALAAYQQAMAIHGGTGDRAGEATTLHNIGAVYFDQGRTGEALDAYEQALDIRREVGDRAGEGTTLHNIGVVYRQQDRLSEALQSYQQALVIARELGDRPGEAATLNSIGLISEMQGRYAEALRIHEQVLGIARNTGLRGYEGGSLHNMGGVYRSLGRYQEALTAYQLALDIRREIGDRTGEAMTLNGIGVVYAHQGRYAEALAAHQQSLIIRREVGDRLGEGTTLNNMGEVYGHMGRYTEALANLQQALLIAQQMDSLGDQATALSNQGTLYLQERLYDDALSAFQQALAIAPAHSQVCIACALNGIGLVYDHQERYADALDAYEQALNMQRKTGNRVDESTTLNNIGLAYAGQGRYAEAQDAYQQSLSIAREVGDRHGEGLTLNNLGYTYHQQGKLDQALGYYRQAMDIFDALRATSGSEASRAEFIAQYAGLYNRSVRLYHEQGQDIEALRTSERGRARAFLDSLSTGYVELSDTAAAGLLEREQEAYAARQAAQDAVARARGAQPLDADLVAELEAQLATAEEEHVAALAAIQARGDQLAALVPGRGGVLELAEVQALLDEQTTLVSYHVLGDAGSLAFVITRDVFEVVELPDATPEQLRTAVADLSQWLRDNPENPHPLRLRELYSWLVTPLANHLNTPRIGIIPHQLLHYVPFAALTDGETYFGQRYALFTLPSASSLRFIQANAAKTPGASALVFGNPETGDPNLTPLGYAESEARSVASLLHASVAIGAEASESRLREGATGAGVVHLAAHGGYNTANPLYSTIYLAPSDQASGDDGRLETHEVYGLDLKAADLVVLSACQSNVGELSAGDELVGLTRAFFFAGTPTVLSSLWSVDDAATEQLMTTFYRYWETGMDKAEALQAAQAEVRSDPRWGSPFYWAGFVLNGDPGEPGQAEVFGRVSVLGIRLPVHNLALYVIITMVLLAATAIIVLLVRRRHH